MVISVDRYDRYLHHAESVSWSYRVPLSPGWTPVPTADLSAVEPVLAPSTFATPMPGVGAYVRGVRVEEAGIEVDVEAVQVDADAGGTGR